MKPVISTLASDAAERFGTAVALTVAGGMSFSFRELNDRAARFAGGLARLGLGAGDRIVLHLPNCWEWVVAYHAIARLGAVVVPANILLSAPEVSFIAKDSGAKLVILPKDRRSSLKLEAGVRTVTEGDFHELLVSDPAPPAQCAPGDLFTIGYTSGTTGQPKGVMLTHGALFASLSGTATIHARHRGDTVLTGLPFPHVYGNIVMNAAFLAGTKLVTMACFNAGEALELIGRERVTLFEGVPTMYYQMLAHPNIAAADLSSLTRCTVGGQTMPVAKIEAVMKRFGCPLLELRGMTELAGPVITHSPYWPVRPGSIGLPFPGVEARLADLADRKRPAAPGEAGELLIRGPMMMRGYWNNPAATAETIDADGLAGHRRHRQGRCRRVLLHCRSQEGHDPHCGLQHLSGRAGAGDRHAPRGGDGCRCRHRRRGKGRARLCVRHAGATLDEAALIAHCRQRLAAYKVPRRVLFVDELPRNSTGKILRRLLPQMVCNAAPMPKEGTSHDH